jgi:flagellum-specific peptidoglycan hydrolase FlgJ
MKPQKGLRRAGYATDPRYPKINFVHRTYNLGQFDAQVLGNNYFHLLKIKKLKQ